MICEILGEGGGRRADVQLHPHGGLKKTGRTRRRARPRCWLHDRVVVLQQTSTTAARCAQHNNTATRSAGSAAGAEVSNISVNDAPPSPSAQVRRREPQLARLAGAAAPGRPEPFQVAPGRAPDPDPDTAAVPPPQHHHHHHLPSAVAILSRRRAAAGLIRGAARKGEAVSSPRKFGRGEILVETRSGKGDSPRPAAARGARRWALKVCADAGSAEPQADGRFGLH